MANNYLLGLAATRAAGKARGITSVCSSHPDVIAAALAHGRNAETAVLIEATCNQVNQYGGYTGMQPVDFRRFVECIAIRQGFDMQNLILGGDHLGPNPWKMLAADVAMENAGQMVAAYAAAGFAKIHLDASMPCAGDPATLPEEVIATRAAYLAQIAETYAVGARPVYVIGTEVPVPGGALEEVSALNVTTPRAARTTIALHREAFVRAGIEPAFERVIGLVVQPGVEFGNENVVPYSTKAAQDLIKEFRTSELVFEAHSTDYQTPEALSALVRDGFAILKVGPGLTFAWREAIYGLDCIADYIFARQGASLRSKMEQIMLEQPSHWQDYYHGSTAQQKMQRHYSYSDRIRYYWSGKEANDAVVRLLRCFGDMQIPLPLISQYLGNLYSGVSSGAIMPTAPELLRASIVRVLNQYAQACIGGSEKSAHP